MHNFLLIIWSMFLPSRTTSSVSSVVNTCSRKVSAEMTSKTEELGKEQYINFLYYYITVIFNNVGSSSHKEWVAFELKSREDFIFNTFILQRGMMPFNSFLARSILSRLAFKIKDFSGTTSYVLLSIVRGTAQLTEDEFTDYQNTLVEKLITIDTSYDESVTGLLRGIGSNVQ